jgi:hypothetical protein
MFIQVVTIGHVLDDIAELPHDRSLWGEVPSTISVSFSSPI